jgi:hypothetical protein
MESTAIGSGPVLVASDFSEAADEAIRQAHEWAIRSDRELSALHVMGTAPCMPCFLNCTCRMRLNS